MKQYKECLVQSTLSNYTRHSFLAICKYYSFSVISRLFQKWCSSGVVSAFRRRETIDFTGFFGTFQDTAVIGGGPAGIEAARTAAQRGHTVDLYEKEDHLGGVLTMAGAPKFKQDIKKYVEWTIHSISGQERVSVHLNSEVRAEDLKGKDYDAVIVAVGAEPVIPKFAKGREDVVWVGDVELGKVSAKKQVVIVGAGLTGCEAALSLAKAGKEVTLVDMIDVCDFGRGGAKFNQIALRGLLEAEQVKMIGGVKMNIEGDRIVFVKNEKTIELSYEQIILSLGVKANEEKVQAFADAGREVVFVGDCNTKIGTLYHAVHTAHEAASVL